MEAQVDEAVPWKEADRLRALRDTGLLDTAPERAFDDIVLLAKAICGAPIAAVSLVDEGRQWFKARSGLSVDETPRDTSVCALAIRQQGLFEVRDLPADPLTARFALVTGTAHLRFYAGVPLVTTAGLPLGTLCVIDTVPRPDGLRADQREALEALARQTVSQIELGAMFRSRELALSSSQVIGTWDWDVRADRVYADARLAGLHGLDPAAAAAGLPINAFLDRVHPDDLPILRGGLDRALGEDVPFHAEFRLVGEDGAPRWLVAQGRPERDGDGRVRRFPGISLDVTARRGAQARTQALLDLNDRIRDLADPGDIAFAASEIVGRTLGVSRAGYGTIDPAAETIVIERDWNAPGVASIAGLLHFRDYGSYIDDLKRGDTVMVADAAADARTRDRAGALAAIGACSFINMPLTEAGGFVALAFVNNRRARRFTAAEIAFLREAAERVRAASERRRAEAELAALNASLEREVEERTRDLLRAEELLRQSQKMEAVGQLTGGLAHDFNNMLTGISGALEMMRIRLQQGRTADLERYATAAQGAASRAAALTHRLLAFSRRQTLDPRPTDGNRLIAGMDDLVRRTVGPGIAVEVVQAAGLWSVLVDRNQLENALLNLCINARDAMPDGGRLTIETANKWLDERAAAERDIPAGQYISVCVTDTGTGMTPEVRARAFDPFFTTKPLGEGTGLGLSMIYGFARQSGGQVRIYSELAQGTTMCLYLPRHYGEDRPAPPQAEVVPPRAERNQTVLVCDDESTIRMLVGEVLEELGYHVLEAGEGASALHLLRSDLGVDLLITDVGLPGNLNGRQLADAARALRPDLRVLFITGYAENAVVGNGQLEQGTALVTKPFSMETLAVRVRDILAR